MKSLNTAQFCINPQSWENFKISTCFLDMHIYLQRHIPELLLSGSRTKTPLAVHPFRRKEWVGDVMSVVSPEMLIKH